MERRNLERFDLKIPARVQAMVLEQEHETQELLTTNVCSGGAFFQTPQPLPKGTEVKVDLTISLSKLKALKDEYQQAVISNAKAFAEALKDAGLNVAGDPEVSYTQTHQVILNVGYGKGPELAKHLEENNIIVNYQAGPYEEGFSAAGALRMGVAEMTRFGMQAKDFQTLAQLTRDIIVNNKTVANKVKSIRKGFLDLKFCFTEKQYEHLIQELHTLI